MLISIFLNCDVYLPKEDTLLAEGMYDSPNHYLRLRIFLLALKLNKKLPKLLGVLLDKKTTRALPILKSLGFKDIKFIYKNYDTKINKFKKLSISLFEKIKLEKDILNLNLKAEYLHMFFMILYYIIIRFHT